MNDLLRDAAERAARYLDNLPNRPVQPDPAAVERLATLYEPLPAAPSDPSDTLALLDDLGSPATMATAGPRFFGFVIGGSVPAAVAASWLATAWDQNAGLYVATPIASTLEDVSLRWLIELLGLPPGSGGGFVTGATMANFTALAAARHAVLKRAGWDVEAQGLFGAPPVTVIVSEEAHVTLYKSLAMLGFGRERVVRVPVDNQGRMRANMLPRIESPAIVCLQAGNVNTGAFDPIEEACAVAREAGAWIHVDGAFGLWAAASPQLAHLARGIDQADSWATDAHKWLNVPYDSGLAICRDVASLREAMGTHAAYLIEGERRDASNYTPELSRRARGVEVWAALRSLGRSGVREIVERNCRQARRFAEGLSAAGYEVLNDIVLNQVLVSFGDPATTRRVVQGIQEDGTCWCGATVWQGQTAMRISVCSWATTDDDVERSLEAMIRVASKQAVAL